MKIRLFCLFFFLTYFTAHSANFVVTSNADSGPGTLREALTLAASNGTVIYDNIRFNLPGNTEADRTILLLSELPLVTNHLILDATSQPGPNLGSSIAKIMIKANRFVYQASAYNLGCFNIIGITDVEIYGFAFDQFTSLIVTTNPNGQRTDSQAIYIVSSSGIIIGAPGKGNVFIENDKGIYAASDPNYQNKNGKIKVQSNWFGLDLDGSESAKHKNWLALILANDLEFGGPDQSYGNILGGFSAHGLEVTGNNCKVRFNYFGFIGDGTLGFRGVVISLGINGGEFSDNQANRLGIEVSGKNLKILRNKELAIPITILSRGIRMRYAENIQIGSDNIADANEFLNGETGPFFNYGSNNVEVRKNIIHCTSYAYSFFDAAAIRIQVVINNDTEYSGTATPNSLVYIYNDRTDCPSCSPLEFYTQVTADITGKWAITGDFRNNRFVANTTLVNTSSAFTQPRILLGGYGVWYDKTDPTCGKRNGTLEIVNPLNLLKVEWYNRKDEKIGEGLKIENLPPGEYYAKGYNGKCYTKTDMAALFNVEPKFIDIDLKIKQPGCGQKDGSIRGLYYNINTVPTTFKWVDENNKVVSASSFDLSNIGPGSYTFVVSIGTDCIKSYGPIVLENAEGPNIKRGDAVITRANCDNNDGSIIGVTATGAGNIRFIWKDDKDNVVSETADLTSAKAGKYTLEVKDESTCGLISSSFEVVADHTMNIDEQLVYIKKSTCGKANGSINKIKAIGSDKVKWLNERDEVVGESIDLIEVPSGKYRLVIFNDYCDKISSVFSIEEANSNDNYISVKQLKNATCNRNSGSITVSFTQATPRAFKWLNEHNQIIPGTNTIADLSAGFYKLYITDENSCESLYDTYEIITIPPPAVNEEQVRKENDNCGLKTGSVMGLVFSGGIKPYRYEWRNQANELVGRGADLIKVAAGVYTAQIFDSENCSVLTSSFTISVENNSLPVPEVSPVQICAAGKATIIPNQLHGGVFLLYQSLIATQPLATTRDIFNIQVSKTETYFVSYKNGICESNRVPVLVEVAEHALKIANSFSPNNDGVNDTWKINGLINYPEFVLKIYNRYGQDVFTTRDPYFTYNGVGNNGELPVGVYYYVLKLRETCSTITGSLTLIR